MKRLIFILLAVLVVGAGAGYVYRGTLRNWYRQSTTPTLPVAQDYQPDTTDATSTAQATEAKTKTRPVDPFSWSGPLPAEKNLAVPFLSQAPTMNWDLPYQEACEETSAIMVNAYYNGKHMAFTPSDGNKAILDLIAFEEQLLGKYKDTTADETAQFIRGYFHRPVVIKESNDPNDLKKAIANGYPVIVPANGKTLANSNFRNGGPAYHMLVVKGWTKDGHWITNDPGTRLGSNFLYTEDNLINSMHDWNGGDVKDGKPEMIVIMPK